MFRRNSVNQRRALSRGALLRHRAAPVQASYVAPNDRIQDAHIHQNLREQILNKLDKMTEDEIDKVSKQLDEITRADEEQKHQDEFDRNHHQELTQEALDQVGELPSPNNFKDDKSITELSEYGSKSRDVRSRSSKRSSKSYISKLQQDLDSERAQRLKLEKEIEHLKKISSEISSRLCLNH